MSVYPKIEEVHPNRLVSYYCMSSYLYYDKGKNVLTDANYDALCKRILKENGSITDILETIHITIKELVIIYDKINNSIN